MAYSNQSGPVRVRFMSENEKRASAGREGGRKGVCCKGRSGTDKGIGKRKASAASVPVRMVEGIEVRISRKQVKNLNLRIARNGDHVDVSAPAWISDSEIEAFIRKKRLWIESHLAQAADTPMARASRATPEEVAAWREAVSACVPALIAAWEPIMGVKHGSVAYRNMTSRWGSCQPSTGRICINVRLALYPPECLEYVVVHELCHLLERGHGPRFHQLMDAFMPDWKTRRAKLR